ncbi:MAG: PKD domain-containing protein [Flavobacteriales bacterium]|nr:PKD domain-containing protein [Flavobacteriales bacterium]MCB9363068.1 PKD domain-containing protein [Flavobacteriales bacterium]
MAICLLAINKTNAAHLIGGTMQYECLGNDEYKIILTIYKDCFSSTPFDQTADIGFFDAAGTLIYSFDANATVTESIPIELNNPCLTAPPAVCVEKTDYELIITLPPIIGGYDVVYQRCCRNASAINIVNPSIMGSTYQVHIPDPADAICNTSPKFNNPPPTIMCTSYNFNYDLSATDIDGDSLYYFFGNPNHGGTQADPAPSPPLAPPYNNIPWNSGYSTNYQIDAFPQFTLDPNTGYLSGTPINSGFYTFCVNIQEYRNGVLLNEIYRDFLLVITDCEANTHSDFSDEINSSGQNNFCSGTTVTFLNNSTNSSYYFWDFGEPNTNADTSNLISPTYTYQDTGIYNVMLVSNPGYSCADTVFHEFQVYPPINPFFTTQNDQCLPNNQYNLEAFGDFNSNATITWDFGTSTTISNSIGITTQVSFIDTGIQTINLTIENNGCITNYSDDVYIYPFPIADFPEQSIFCDGQYSIQFENNSLNANNYYWNFGDLTTSSDTSILPTPLPYNYPDSGSYNIMLVASQHNLCFDTIFNTYSLHPLVTSFFDKQAIQCLSNNLFSLNAEGIFSSNATFNWDFNTSTSVGNPTQVSYSDTGRHLVTLTIEDYGCSNSYIDTLIVYPNPVLNFDFTPKIGCQPLEINFYDSSFAATPISFNWDFGDGSYSSENSPTHVYQNSGTFDVSLTISTNEGCIDVVNKTLTDTITVHPKPAANFSVNPTETYFFNNVITVKDLTNTYYQEFDFGDGSLFTNQNIAYSYLDTGHYQLSQTVSTELGCKDTLYQKIWIKPDFTVFVPNSFTPNGDYLNDIFTPKLQGVMEYEFQVFNRWGQLIFETDNLETGWDGSSNNSPSPEGVYIWKIKAKTIDYLLYTPSGHVNLIR